MSTVVSARGRFDVAIETKASHRSALDWERCLMGKQPRKALFRAFFIVLIGSFLVDFVVQPLRVGGDSMQPTFESSEWLVADRLSYRFSQPEIGDVVAIRTHESNVTILKRIIAGPGDSVVMVKGRLKVNGHWLEEPYAATDDGWSMPGVSMGANEYWVVGDNRAVSVFGKVHRDHIIGKVW